MGGALSQSQLFEAHGTSKDAKGISALSKQTLDVLSALLQKDVPEKHESWKFEDFLAHYLRHYQNSGNGVGTSDPKQRLSKILQGDKYDQADAIYALATLSDCGLSGKGLPLRLFVRAACTQGIASFWNEPGTLVTGVNNSSNSNGDDKHGSDDWIVDWCLVQPREIIVQLYQEESYPYSSDYDASVGTFLTDEGESEQKWRRCADKWLKASRTSDGIDVKTWRKWWLGNRAFAELVNMSIAHTLYLNSGRNDPKDTLPVMPSFLHGTSEENLQCPQLVLPRVGAQSTGSISRNEGLLYNKGYLLDSSLAWAISRELPLSSRKLWRCVYSSNTDGRSWSTFQGAIERAGSILLLVKEKLSTRPHSNDSSATTDNSLRPEITEPLPHQTTHHERHRHKEGNSSGVFGVYFDKDLERYPSWQGNSLNFVFTTTRPQLSSSLNTSNGGGSGSDDDGLRVFRSTGFNKHYQYFNYATKTLPNGLGAGGQMGHFGLWIDSGFTQGSSNTAATFGSSQLSTESEFTIESIEAWVVRPRERLPDEEEEDGSRKQTSVMDAHQEAANMLEMANRKMYSKDLARPSNDMEYKQS
ncbi:hypothetical protein GGI07_002320 [Coemansia sp. Benny D115]|nr:hypothetical protein GGI07_002320 [Coemansia sp. Benny D115]